MLSCWIGAFFAGTLYSQLAMNTTQYSQCLFEQAQGVPPGTRSYGGACDQFGKYCHMWECVDYFQLPSLPTTDPWVSLPLVGHQQQQGSSSGEEPGGGSGSGGGGGDGSNSGLVWGVKWSDQVRAWSKRMLYGHNHVDAVQRLCRGGVMSLQ